MPHMQEELKGIFGREVDLALVWKTVRDNSPPLIAKLEKLEKLLPPDDRT